MIFVFLTGGGGCQKNAIPWLVKILWNSEFSWNTATPYIYIQSLAAVTRRKQSWGWQKPHVAVHSSLCAAALLALLDAFQITMIQSLTPWCLEGHMLNCDILLYYYPWIPNISKQEKKNWTWTVVLVRPSGVGMLVSRNQMARCRVSTQAHRTGAGRPHHACPPPHHAVATVLPTHRHARVRNI